MVIRVPGVGRSWGRGLLGLLLSLLLLLLGGLLLMLLLLLLLLRSLGLRLLGGQLRCRWFLVHQLPVGLVAGVDRVDRRVVPFQVEFRVEVLLADGTADRRWVVD